MSTAVLWLGAVLADATIVINEELSVAEGSADNIISNALLQADDPGATNPVLTYTLVTTPANGDLFLNGVASPLTPTATFRQTDIDNNFLSYTHDGSETTSDSFNFTVETSTTLASGTFLIAINQMPEVLPQEFDVDENTAAGTFVNTIVASDLNVGDILTYTIRDGNDGTAFEVGSSGIITVANAVPLDFETNQNITFTVQVEDTGMLTDTAVITVNVLDVNDPPALFPAGPFSVPENSADTNPVGTIPATDDDLGAGDMLTFTIEGGNTGGAFGIGSSNGQIVVADGSLLDFEMAPTSYNLTIQVADNSGATDSAVVTINVTDAPESPTVIEALFDIDENSSNATTVGTVVATDPDAADAGNLIFDILPAGNTGGAFAIDDNGQITVANSSQLDYETKQSFMLSIIVTDTVGLDNTANVTININNLFDEAPTVNNANFSVAEGSPNGVVVGTVTATDPEFTSGDALTFSIIGGNTGTVFAINSSSGQITVPDTSKLDSDAMPTFNLTVQATDKGGKIDTGTIAINVTPLPITYVYMPLLLNNYPPIEPNNNCSQAYPIGTGTNYEFTSDDVEDWYAITLTSQQNVAVVLSSFEPSQGQLLAYGGTCGGTLQLLQNDGSSSTTKSLNLNNLAPGTYYIRVYSNPVTNTTYKLQVTFN